MGGEVGGVDRTTLGAGTGDGRAMESLHCTNRSRGSGIALSWEFQVVTVESIIAHVSMDMACMMHYCGVRECCAR